MQGQIKFIGMVLIVASCTGFGLQLSYLYRQRINQCRQVEQCLQRLLGEIRFHQIPLEEALRETGKILGGNGFAAFFLRVSQRLIASREQGEGQSEEMVTLTMLWQDELRSYLEDSLLQGEQELLLSLGRELGSLDLEEQVRSLQYCLEQWRRQVEKLQRQEETHGRLYRGVGVSVGVFLAILLL